MVTGYMDIGHSSMGRSRAKVIAKSYEQVFIGSMLEYNESAIARKSEYHKGFQLIHSSCELQP